MCVAQKPRSPVASVLTRRRSAVDRRRRRRLLPAAPIGCVHVLASPLTHESLTAPPSAAAPPPSPVPAGLPKPWPPPCEIRLPRPRAAGGRTPSRPPAPTARGPRPTAHAAPPAPSTAREGGQGECGTGNEQGVGRRRERPESSLAATRRQPHAGALTLGTRGPPCGGGLRPGAAASSPSLSPSSSSSPSCMPYFAISCSRLYRLPFRPWSCKGRAVTASAADTGLPWPSLPPAGQHRQQRRSTRSARMLSSFLPASRPSCDPGPARPPGAPQRPGPERGPAGAQAHTQRASGRVRRASGQQPERPS